MVAPLYQEARETCFNHTGHRGLWWNKFFHHYPADFAAPGEAKFEFLQEVAGQSLCGERAQLLQTRQRMIALLSALGGETRIFSVAWRFVTGLGNDHPCENGFAWHPVLATPYLPAAGVKGLLRGWMEWNNQADPRLNSWFGFNPETKDTEPENAGWLVFFDAVPVAPVSLAVDVMTPHYGKWYEHGDQIELKNNEPDPERVPADWHSPVPVPFLVVKKASFLFGVTVRENLPKSIANEAKAALPEVVTLLEEALQWAGAGAKTAAGYGRMEPDAAEQARLVEQQKAMQQAIKAQEAIRQQEAAQVAEQARLAAMDPFDAKIETILANWKDKTIKDDWLKLHQSLWQSGVWLDEEKRPVAQKVCEMMQAAGVWLPEERNKKGERARQIKQMLDNF